MTVFLKKYIHVGKYESYESVKSLIKVVLLVVSISNQCASFKKKERKKERNPLFKETQNYVYLEEEEDNIVLTCVNSVAHDPAIRASIVSLHDVRRRSPAPAADHEQNLVRYARPGEWIV